MWTIQPHKTAKGAFETQTIQSAQKHLRDILISYQVQWTGVIYENFRNCFLVSFQLFQSFSARIVCRVKNMNLNATRFNRLWPKRLFLASYDLLWFDFILLWWFDRSVMGKLKSCRDHFNLFFSGLKRSPFAQAGTDIHNLKCITRKHGKWNHHSRVATQCLNWILSLKPWRITLLNRDEYWKPDISRAAQRDKHSSKIKRTILLAYTHEVISTSFCLNTKINWYVNLRWPFRLAWVMHYPFYREWIMLNYSEMASPSDCFKHQELFSNHSDAKREQMTFTLNCILYSYFNLRCRIKASSVRDIHKAAATSSTWNPNISFIQMVRHRRSSPYGRGTV